MLGSIVEVIAARRSEEDAREGSLSYRGHVFCAGGQPPVRREAYVVGLGRVPTRFTGRVVAVWSHGDGLPALIVAPRERVLYEPELRTKLGLGPGEGEMRCLYEKSCGAVIFRRDGGRLQFLIVKNKKGRNWGFPKGHVELGENEEQTALREVREETGLDVTLCRGFRAVSRYSLWNRASKRVVFFLAEYTGGEILLQEEEIERARWLSSTAAAGFFRFDNDRRVLRSAVGWMKKHHLLDDCIN